VKTAIFLFYAALFAQAPIRYDELPERSAPRSTGPRDLHRVKPGTLEAVMSRSSPGVMRCTNSRRTSTA
jgi:hypothetical protein